MKNSTHLFKFKKLLPSKNMFFGNRNLTATEILFFRSNHMKKHLSLFLLGNCSFEHYKMVLKEAWLCSVLVLELDLQGVIRL